jgi:D-serine deaminase-like pyridoxal phosphate-dependent protein
MSARPPERPGGHLLNLSETLETVVDGRVKGVPGRSRPLRLREIGEQGWNVLAEDLPLPLLVIKRTALDHNLRLMHRYCQRHRVQLAPHGKTTMAPQLFDEQLRMGAWGITAATVQQLQVYRRAGVHRVMFANQLVGAPGLGYVFAELERDPGFDFYCWVDSAASVELLADAAKCHRSGRPVKVLAEIGYPCGRGGVRTRAQLDALVGAIAARARTVELAGVAGFEGLLDTEPLAGQVAPPAHPVTKEAYLDTVAGYADRLLTSGTLPDGFILTAGGSTSFGAVVAAFGRFTGSAATVLLRSGCYITHDHLMNARTSPLGEGNSGEAIELGHLEPALELWCYVQSTPEDGLALLTFGRRDAPFDYGLPVPLRRYPAGSRDPVPLANARVVALNDQHAYLRDASGAAVGDRIVLGISHPCTAFDKWRLVPVVNDDFDVIDGILTYF